MLGKCSFQGEKIKATSLEIQHKDLFSCDVQMVPTFATSLNSTLMIMASICAPAECNLFNWSSENDPDFQPCLACWYSCAEHILDL